ncbi:hypothetical protein [Ruegeria aquimaris]|uniref:Uncharacterized protein n=1 Tax=Ruegeria aquimaris TaxID=2984333 RepID=A0ABT3AEN7_9RHOB|nr:hypothetical protein [Ruegeria sp. XHP0148]MCV2887098.1 hypothetical protein [Ruegeria sp. XHP0148]
MMLSILSPLHAQAAAIRALGYAVSTQLRVAQIFACSAINAPMAQVRAIQAAASLPSEVTRAVAAVRAEDRPGKVAVLPKAPVAPRVEETAVVPAESAPVADTPKAPAPTVEPIVATDEAAASVVAEVKASAPEVPETVVSHPAKAAAKPASAQSRRRKAPSAPAPMPKATAKTDG